MRHCLTLILMVLMATVTVLAEDTNFAGGAKVPVEMTDALKITILPVQTKAAVAGAEAEAPAPGVQAPVLTFEVPAEQEDAFPDGTPIFLAGITGWPEISDVQKMPASTVQNGRAVFQLVKANGQPFAKKTKFAVFKMTEAGPAYMNVDESSQYAVFQGTDKIGYFADFGALLKSAETTQ